MPPDPSSTWKPCSRSRFTYQAADRYSRQALSWKFHTSVWRFESHSSRALTQSKALCLATDNDWTHGAFYYHWPEPGGDVHAAAMAVSNLFFNDQWLGKYNQPSFNRILAELEGMVLDILGAPDGAHCCLTTGGTESIILA